MRAIWVVAIVLGMSGWAGAQEQTTNPDDLNRKYTDAVAQLKAAQDRRNELAAENEKLGARIAELEQKLKEAERREAEFNERTYQLRSLFAAWKTFLSQQPVLLQKWRLFMENGPLAAPWTLPEFVDSTNPLSIP